MEDETPSTQKTSPLFTIMAILGLGIAVIAAAVGGVALKKISATTNDINARIEKNAAMELEIKKISDRVDALALQVSDMKSADNSKINNLTSQVQKVIDVLNSNINEIRGEVVKNREALEKLATRPAKVVATKKAEQTEQQNQDATTSEQKQASGKVHKIQNGDTFAKLAKKYNATVSALMKANPNVNPSRLKIGQEIQIP